MEAATFLPALMIAVSIDSASLSLLSALLPLTCCFCLLPDLWCMYGGGDILYCWCCPEGECPGCQGRRRVLRKVLPRDLPAVRAQIKDALQLDAIEKQGLGQISSCVDWQNIHVTLEEIVQ